MSSTPPGWYPDAQGVNRWFDGTSWTEHTQAAAPVTPPPASPPPAPEPPAPATPWGSSGYQSYDGSSSAPEQVPDGRSSYPPSTPPYQQPYQQPYGAPYSQPAYGAPGPPGPRRRTGLIVGLGAAGVLLVVLAVGGAVLLVRGSSNTDEASGVATTSSEPTASDPTVSSEPVTPSPEPSSPLSSAPIEDPGPAGSTDPEKVADGFMKAIFSGDCAAAEAYVSDQVIENEGSCGGSKIPTGTFDGLTYEVGKADVNGDTATVPVTLVVDLGGNADLGDIPGTTLTLTLQRQGSRWLVDNLA